MGRLDSSEGVGRRLGIAGAAAVGVVAAIATADKLREGMGSHQETVPGFKDERSRIAHLLRRAGFGSSPSELDAAVSRGYDATLDQLLAPSDDHDAADDELDRLSFQAQRPNDAQRWWLVRMRYTSRPLVEKMTLFWHGHFATGLSKVGIRNLPLMRQQNDLFRLQGMGNFSDLLLGVSKDPAMIIWLDGQLNHKAAPNENYGRELMELFTLGIGNYGEDDVKAAARAFTGWSIDNERRFVFNAGDHDDGPKTLLGQTGNFNGDDVVSMLVAHPATATRLATRLARFFVSDPPDSQLVKNLAQTYLSSHYDIRTVLRALFKSDAFSSAASYHALIKSPTEFVVGTLRSLDIRTDGIGLPPIMSALGQQLFNPPDVSGWAGGGAWISTQTMLARDNMANTIATATKPESGWVADLQQAYGLKAVPAASELVDAAVNHLVDGDLTSANQARLYRYLGVKPSEPIDLGSEELKVRGLLYLMLSAPAYNLN
jgi:uncharacterized protein (DUF1800 family)